MIVKVVYDYALINFLLKITCNKTKIIYEESCPKNRIWGGWGVEKNSFLLEYFDFEDTLFKIKEISETAENQCTKIIECKRIVLSLVVVKLQ